MDSRISESRKASKNGEFNSLSLSGFDQEEVSMSASSSSPISVVSNGFGTSLGSPKSSAPPGFSLEANGSEAGVSSQGGNLILAGSHAPPVREKEQQSDSVPASGIKEGPEEPESGIIGASLGAAAGGIVGGIAGGLVGGVVGAIGGTLGGAVLGGLAGNAIENAMLPVVEGILSPQDNFAGRSTTNFGLGEVIDLSFRSTATAASMGGLKWEIKSGGGKLSNLTSNGSGDYTCGGTVGAVTLELKIETGSNAGHVMASKNLNIVAPNDALMERDGRAVRHENNKWSAGFYGEMFMRPKNVSFTMLQFREGSCSATASGFLARWNGLKHETSAAWLGIGGGNSSKGNKVSGIDNVHTGTLNGPYSAGDFMWPIPWQYRVKGGSAITFTVANHHATSDAAGTATIEKKGAGPFSKMVGDVTVSN